MSFSGAGLALDIIGAILLSVGLFRHARPTTWGWARWPEDAASDRAYGTSGGLSLLVGFLGQLLGSAGLGASTRCAVLVSALVALNLGSLLAYGVYGLAYLLSMGAELGWIARQPELADVSADVSYQHRPRFPQFWYFERTTRRPGGD